MTRIPEPLASSIRDLVRLADGIPDALGLEHALAADDARSLGPLQRISPRAFAATLALVERYGLECIDTASLAEAVEAEEALVPLAEAARRLSRRLTATLRARRAVGGRQVLKTYALLKAQLRYAPDTRLSDDLAILRGLVGVRTGPRAAKPVPSLVERHAGEVRARAQSQPVRTEAVAVQDEATSAGERQAHLAREDVDGRCGAERTADEGAAENAPERAGIDRRRDEGHRRRPQSRMACGGGRACRSGPRRRSAPARRRCTRGGRRRPHPRPRGRARGARPRRPSPARGLIARAAVRRPPSTQV